MIVVAASAIRRSNDDGSRVAVWGTVCFLREDPGCQGTSGQCFPAPPASRSKRGPHNQTRHRTHQASEHHLPHWLDWSFFFISCQRRICPDYCAQEGKQRRGVCIPRSSSSLMIQLELLDHGSGEVLNLQPCCRLREVAARHGHTVGSASLGELIPRLGNGELPCGAQETDRPASIRSPPICSQ